mgnify:CR=1 FL=1
MAKRTPVEKAQTHGLNLPEVVIFFSVTAWFNGKTVSVHDRPNLIATAYAPPLRQLCGDEWEPTLTKRTSASLSARS